MIRPKIYHLPSVSFQTVSLLNWQKSTSAISFSTNDAAQTFLTPGFCPCRAAQGGHAHHLPAAPGIHEKKKVLI
jgi:hypothetical protein